MSRPCSGRGGAPSAAASSAEEFAQCGFAGRRGGTRPPRAWRASAATKRATSPVHGASSTMPGRRNISHGARAAAAAALSRRAKRALEHHEIAAGDVGDGRGVVVRTAIGNQHFGDQAGRGARHQRGQRRHQRALRIARRDDDAEHVVRLGPSPRNTVFRKLNRPSRRRLQGLFIGSFTEICSCFVRMRA